MPTVGDPCKQCRQEPDLLQGSHAWRGVIYHSSLAGLKDLRCIGAETLFNLRRVMDLPIHYLMTDQDSDEPSPEVQMPTTRLILPTWRSC
jgi:hypothetical protein